MIIRFAIATAVRKLRLERRLSQGFVAAAARMTENHYRKIERGTHMPSNTALENICIGLGICPSELFYVIADNLNIHELENDI